MDRDLDEVLDRLPPELLRPPALPSVEPAFDRLPPLPFASVRPAFERDEPDLAPVEPDFARDELDRLRLLLLPLFAPLPLLLRLLLLPLLLARLLLLRDLLVDLPFEELRELLDRRELDRRRDDPPLRSDAGISSRATAFASCSICF